MLSKFLLSFILLISGLLTLAQIPNQSFEVWNTVMSHENPVNFSTSNDDMTEDFNVTKTTDKFAGSYAMRIANKGTIDNMFTGFAFIGKYNDQLGGEQYLGGFGINYKPDSIKAYFKYNCTADDSAVMFVITKKSGKYLSNDVFKFYGTQNIYKKKSFKLSVPKDTPDSVIIGFFASNLEGMQYKLSNWIQVDNIGLVKGATTTMVPNGDLESWQPVNRNKISGWDDANDFLPAKYPYVTKSTDKQSGSFSAKITTSEIYYNDESRILSMITSGKLKFSNKKAVTEPATGGFPITVNPNSLSLWYKYNNENNTDDRAIVYVKFWKYYLNTKWDMGTAQVELAASENFSKITIPFNIGNPNLPQDLQTADSCNIIISSYNYFQPDNIGYGNEIIVDNLNFDYPSLGYTVSGIVRYDNDSILRNNIKVYLKTQENVKLDSSNTNANGFYIFNNVPDGNYKLEAVTTKKAYVCKPTDALTTMRAYVMMYTFKSPLRKTAADVNKDNKVNTTDALQINRKYVGLISSFNLPAWVFENPSITVAGENLVKNFKGICAADVTGAYKPPAK